MKSTKLRGGAALAAALTFAMAPTAFAEDNRVLDRLDRLEHRIDALESDVKNRDAKIQQLENQVKDRDAKIESLERSGAQAAATSAAQVQPAAGHPASQGTDTAAPMTDRVNALEGTVNSLQTTLSDVKSQQARSAAEAPKITTKGGLKVESADGQFSFQAIGRLNYDAAFYNQDKSRLGDGSQLRRARLGATGKMFGDWMYKLELDFGRDTGAGTVATKEAWIKYIGVPNAEFLVGNVPVPFSLEDYTTDLFVTFIERALPTPVFAPERLLGGVAGYYGPNWSVAGGVYGRSVDDPTNVSNEGDQQFVSTGRVTFDPVLEKDELVHLGLGVFYKNPSDQPISFSTKPESNVTAARFLNTGTITNIDHLVEIDPELAFIYGPASLQGEYFWVPVTRTQPNGSTLTPSVDLTGWYTQFSYFVTGESRNYNPKIAKFDRITPFHNLGPSGIGAIELAARISQLSLDDGPRFQFGTERDYTLGVNWYVNPYIRFMMDYVWVRNNASATGNAANLLPGNTSAGYDDPSILELRAQVDW